MKVQLLACHCVKTWCFNFFVLENLVMHCIKWLSFRIHNEIEYNNAILIKTKNAVAANNVAMRTDLIKNKKTEIKQTSVSINVIADDEVNLNKFKKRWSDRWHLKDIDTQNRHEKKMRKFNVYSYCFIRWITIY